jgi:O-acetyl-ADP-ribose deacetylase (regulator of RNase III)
MPAKTIIGNLLDSDAKYIVHQTNCASEGASGIARDIFMEYPYSNIYLNRRKLKHEDKPGTIIIRGNGKEERYIINLMGQYFPGPPTTERQIDTEEKRKKYFFQGLQEVAKIKDLDSVAFPDHIGCGLAAGNWEFYEGLINKFADYVEKEQGAKVFIYKLPSL